MECHKNLNVAHLVESHVVTLFVQGNSPSPDIDPQISQKQFDPLKGNMGNVQKLKACQFSLGE